MSVSVDRIIHTTAFRQTVVSQSSCKGNVSIVKSLFNNNHVSDSGWLEPCRNFKQNCSLQGIRKERLDMGTPCRTMTTGCMTIRSSFTIQVANKKMQKHTREVSCKQSENNPHT
ncbi:hypothetical protein SEMRO_7_G006161.1 [Seminavis robusta]|uniref:Uncharacterized protein n=1 Tax=Seminavis robusta TaxID=568900 RepID=A0A9N8H1T2_9STRA|nr:hypothetical protein SEMRO_7_G006161.1 [Seminavis robusta]|eukprot:Sro7_g006161.1  (114) ;mRNA; r:173605-173946